MRPPVVALREWVTDQVFSCQCGRWAASPAYAIRAIAGLRIHVPYTDLSACVACDWSMPCPTVVAMSEAYREGA